MRQSPGLCPTGQGPGTRRPGAGVQRRPPASRYPQRLPHHHPRRRRRRAGRLSGQPGGGRCDRERSAAPSRRPGPAGRSQLGSGPGCQPLGERPPTTRPGRWCALARHDRTSDRPDLAARGCVGPQREPRPRGRDGVPPPGRDPGRGWPTSGHFRLGRPLRCAGSAVCCGSSGAGSAPSPRGSGPGTGAGGRRRRRSTRRWPGRGRPPRRGRVDRPARRREAGTGAGSRPGTRPRTGGGTATAGRRQTACWWPGPDGTGRAGRRSRPSASLP